MHAYIIRRVLLMIPTMLVVTLTIFVAVRLIPGDIIDIMSGQISGGYTSSKKTEEVQRAWLEQRLGLDKPMHIQYGLWLRDLLQGDLGMSLWRESSINKEIAGKIPVSVELGIFGMITAMLISFPIGIYSAIRQDTVGDYIGRSIAIGFMAVPSFWLGIMVTVFPSLWWGWSPPIRFIPFLKDPLENLAQFALPGVILGMGLCGYNMRYIRTMMLEVLRQDYIRTAWSKGLKERVVVVRHALRNALIPVVTLLGIQLPVLVAGVVILEQIFNLPGIGRFLVSSAFTRDYTVISAITVIVAVFVVFTNLGIDLLYGYLDPRIRYGK